MISRRSSYSAIVISNLWPGEHSGGSLAVQSSLRQYADYFAHVDYVGLVERPASIQEACYQNVAFHHIPVTRKPLWYRFGKSIHTLDPAITVCMKENRVYDRLFRIVDESWQRSCGKLVGIMECITPCIHLPGLKQRYPNMKWIYRSHDIVHRAFELFATQGNLITRAAWRWELFRSRRFEQMVADQSDYYWTITADDAVASRLAFDRNVDGVLGVDIDSSRFRSVEPGEIHTVTYLGSADYRKTHGIRSFIETSWPGLRSSFPSARLVLGGIGTKAFHNPRAGIHGLGFVENAEQFLGQGFIFLNPQQAGTGIKLKSLNALAAGKLLVTSPNGALGLGGKDGVHYIVRENPDGLGDGIAQVWKNPDASRQIAANGRQFVCDHFNAESVRRAFLELIAPVMKDLS